MGRGCVEHTFVWRLPKAESNGTRRKVFAWCPIGPQPKIFSFSLVVLVVIEHSETGITGVVVMVEDIGMHFLCTSCLFSIMYFVLWGCSLIRGSVFVNM
jgi:hypothetical protein